ncbi:shikimate kinase [uncultured Pontibacter sp.]|uniref:shikimate kinase n=1 Tax=uncultured Pontibacter sp. TaxID=453356 RepID=UPI002631FF33|nr:shikimate kinase [uncultured Pontibacter sp.]
MLIFLLGMMGSGKSTLGRQLAQRLGYTFVDLDAWVEQQERKSIAAIFEEQGEEAFRRQERAALEAVVHQHNNAVVATGGGTPCFFDNINHMNSHGITVFLDTPPESITKRLMATNLELRPLLAGKNEGEINSYLRKTLAHRNQFYEQAKYKLKGDTITASQVALLLAKP